MRWCGGVELLEEEDDLTVIGQASSVSEALARVPALVPDVVLDVRLPDGNGVELCGELRSTLPECNCLMLTSYTDEQAMMDATAGRAHRPVAHCHPGHPHRDLRSPHRSHPHTQAAHHIA